MEIKVQVLRNPWGVQIENWKPNETISRTRAENRNCVLRNPEVNENRKWKATGKKRKRKTGNEKTENPNVDWLKSDHDITRFANARFHLPNSAMSHTDCVNGEQFYEWDDGDCMPGSLSVSVLPLNIPITSQTNQQTDGQNNPLTNRHA